MVYTLLPHGSEGQNIWAWNWEPSVLIGLFALTAAYLLAVGPLRTRLGTVRPARPAQIIAFLLGTLTVLIALVSPLDHLADEVSFGAHMVQHILLLGFGPVLWLVGLPDGLLNALVRPNWLRRFAYSITRLIPAFIIFNGIMLFWHIPFFYNLALEHEPIHIFEHLTFMAAAVIGWWPVFGAFAEAAPRASLSVQLFYLFFMMFPSTALAAWITLSPTIIYPFYGEEAHILGLTPMDDQQLSGLIMWIPGNALFFLIFSLTFFRWFRQSSHEDPFEPVSTLKEVTE